MIRFIVYLTVIAIICLGATWLFNNDGVIVANWIGYRIEASVAFTTITIAVFMFIVIAVTELTMWFKNAPKKLSNDLMVNKQIKGLTALSNGFAALIENNTKEAIAFTKTARRLIPDQPYTLLLASEVAKTVGDHESAKKYYSEMLDNKETEMLALKGLSTEAVEEGNYNKAIELANRARELNPKANWSSTALVDLYKKTNKWEEASEIIGSGLKQKFLKSFVSSDAKDERKKLLREKAIISLMQSKKAYSSGDVETATKHAKIAYEIISEFVPAALQLSSCYLAMGRRGKAASIIEKAWQIKPTQELAELFIRIYQHEKMEKKIKRIQNLNSFNPEDAEGLRSIGYLFMDVGALELARQSLEKSINLTETAAALKLLAKVEEKENGNAGKIKELNKKAEFAEPEHSWVCGSCGHTTSNWSASCNKCESFDSYKWAIPSSIKVASPSNVVHVSKRISQS